MSAEEVADLIGRDLSEVRSFYRNYSIVEQARDAFEIEDAQRITDEFGVWNRAMTNSALREFIEAPVPREVREGEYPLPDSARENLATLMTWIFGVPRSDEQRSAGRQSKNGRAIADSREITRLGRVIASERGVQALRDGATLAEAEMRAIDPAAQFTAAIARTAKDLDAALEVAEPALVSSAQPQLTELQGKLDALRAVQ